MNTKHITIEGGKKTATYKFANIPVRLNTVHYYTHLISEDYVTDEEPLLNITTTLEEIDAERQSYSEENGKEASTADAIGNHRIESLLVYRKMATLLLDHDTLLMHGSCLAIDGQGILFTALSGTGKSTHTALWRKIFGDRVVMVNDDKPLVRVSEDPLSLPLIYGTPWNGKHHLSTNTSVPLKAVVFVQRGKDNEIHEVSAKALFPVLYQQTFKADDIVITDKVLMLLSRLASKVKCYSMHCNMQDDAARVAYDGITAAAGFFPS